MYLYLALRKRSQFDTTCHVSFKYTIIVTYHSYQISKMTISSAVAPFEMIVFVIMHVSTLHLAFSGVHCKRIHY